MARMDRLFVLQLIVLSHLFRSKILLTAFDTLLALIYIIMMVWTWYAKSYVFLKITRSAINNDNTITVFTHDMPQSLVHRNTYVCVIVLERKTPVHESTPNIHRHYDGCGCPNTKLAPDQQKYHADSTNSWLWMAQCARSKYLGYGW